MGANMKEDFSIKDRTDKQLIEESMEVIAKVFGKENDGLDEYKRMSIYTIYKERVTLGGMQKHQLDEVLTKMKPLILASLTTQSLEDILRKGIEAYRKQKWKNVFTKLEAYRNA
jgi:hypothetical protein